LGGGVKAEFIRIPAGRFLMGSDDDDADESPVRQVTISKPFYLGKYEVTQEQWERVMGNNPSEFKGAKNPVDRVSWNDCQEFMKKLNAQVNGSGVFRLPTEAEWEYACRARSRTRYSFGDDRAKSHDYAWFRSNSGHRTQPVGRKKPNPWGLYDMHGNLWEWCFDWYGENYYQTRPQVDPTGPVTGNRRVLRGASWDNSELVCRSANRGMGGPTTRDSRHGFRVAVSVVGVD
jgi:formylglycine-generating enzyme required for sulfatase activity